ncbi:aldo/keto reductase [Eubacterium ruminantium]|uniref:aldo/keto reductase n=1 Tax=Eubacterium ruminantium TaxID=42322 RepID=UPI002479CA5A|nr:aldo/keto reductase [Eubacterium ruminantium]
MQYRKDKYGNDISVLGFGCMRFTKKGSSIDIDKAEKEVMAAVKAGVNYFDTAYIYPGSEAAMGEIIARNNIRKDINIATKLPQYLIVSRKAIDKYFAEELQRLRTDYIDYYLMHHLTDVDMWEKLKKIGIIDWIDEKKKSGTIRNIGFSYHGNTENFLKILNDYDWDFCQIQYNYMDEVSQAGVEGLKKAAEKGIPVVIMEPLRGGRLVNLLPEKAKKLIKENKKHYSPAELAFRWLYNQPEVTCVLSGMNSIEMVEENCRTADDALAGHFTEDDHALIDKVKEIIKEKEKVGCTGCRYCMPCPKGVDIPGIFRCYNAMYTEGKSDGRFQFAQTVGLTKEPAFASQCIECGKCEMHCPQNIPIREKLKEADKKLRPLHYKIAIGVTRKVMFRKAKVKKNKD